VLLHRPSLASVSRPSLASVSRPSLASVSPAAVAWSSPASPPCPSWSACCSPPSNGEPELVTLQAGQSLWQLAEEIAPSADPRDVISDILAANELESGSVQAGQRIALPAEYSAE
jgi:hypothetical protein